MAVGNISHQNFVISHVSLQPNAWICRGKFMSMQPNWNIMMWTVCENHLVILSAVKIVNASTLDDFHAAMSHSHVSPGLQLWLEWVILRYWNPQNWYTILDCVLPYICSIYVTIYAIYSETYISWSAFWVLEWLKGRQGGHFSKCMDIWHCGSRFEQIRYFHCHCVKRTPLWITVRREQTVFTYWLSQIVRPLCSCVTANTANMTEIR